MFSLGTKIAYLVCRIFVKEEKNMSKKKWKIPSSYVIIMAIVVLVAIDVYKRQLLVGTRDMA